MSETPAAETRTGSAAPPDDLLPTVFARAVAAHANRLALDIPPGPCRPARVRLTYAELARRADELAVAIAPHAKAEHVVAILLPRTSADLFAAQLAVLRSGAAFTSIDPGAPEAHVRFVIEDSGATCLVADAAGLARVPAESIGADRRVDVGSVARGDRPAGAPPTPAPPAPKSLAYVIYTSGTTGTPTIRTSVLPAPASIHLNVNGCLPVFPRNWCTSTSGT